MLFSLFSASLLSASTVVYTATATPGTLSTGSGTGSAYVAIPLLQISQFNPAFGTLNGVTLRANYTVELSGTVNSGLADGELDLTLTGELRIGSYDLDYCDDSNSEGNSAGTVMKMFLRCNKTSVFFPPQLSDAARTALTGTSTVATGWPGQGSVNYTNMSGYAVKLTSGTMTVTYDYVATPTPEPASIALSTSAFALLALAARRRTSREPRQP